MPPATCVIFNPSAGRGRPQRLRDKVRQLCPEPFDLRETTRPGEAEELARQAAQEGFAVVAAAGGDGTVHEVANGILGSGCPDVKFRVLPIGSANDYAHALAEVARRRPGAASQRVDVGRARTDKGTQCFFVNGLGLGFNGLVTLEARKIRFVRGLPLYCLGFLRALARHFTAPSMTVTFDGQARHGPTLALTVNLGQREGKFSLTPRATLDDGWLDYLHAGPLRRWELIRWLPAMITGGIPENHPRIWLGRCQSVQVQSATPLTVHLDGEFLCQAPDQVLQIDVEILPGKLEVMLDCLSGN